MNVYTRGVWTETNEADDAVISSDKDGELHLKLNGFYPGSISQWGIPDCTLDVFEAEKGPDAPYRYFVNININEWGPFVLVPDDISLLMLVKEFAPIIELYMKQEAHRILLEEYRWKANENGEECEHV